MKWLCTVGVAVSLALQPALADELFGNHPLTPQARDAFVTDLLKKMMPPFLKARVQSTAIFPLTLLPMRVNMPLILWLFLQPYLSIEMAIL